MPTASRHRISRTRTWTEKDPSIISFRVQTALREAMRLEAISSNQYDDLLWIIAQESSGVVGARNSRSSARGLFESQWRAVIRQ